MSGALFIPSLRPAIKASVGARQTYIELSKAFGVSRIRHICSEAHSRPALPRHNHRQSGSTCRQISGEAVPVEETLLKRIPKTFVDSFHFPPSTRDIGGLSSNDVDQEVVLHGYLGPVFNRSKSLSFVWLHSSDLKHCIQVVSSIPKGTQPSPQDAHEMLRHSTQHVPVAITGIVKGKAPSKQEFLNDSKRIQDVELQLKAIYILNDFPTDVMMEADTNFGPEQRNLQLRTMPDLRNALQFRSTVAQLCRQNLLSQKFTEIETPLLFKSTPEGAREFLVPTRRKGLSYALPQSPQQYKQILMGSGIPRYFQIAKCFRDEDLRADRQPEFTQLDLEMSFVRGEQVMNLIESLLVTLWETCLEYKVSEPFPRITYEQAMAKYGSDKPDMRLGMELHNVGELLPVDLVSKIGPLTRPAVDITKLTLTGNPSETRKFIGEFMDSPEAQSFLENPDGQPGIFIYDSKKPLFGLQPFGFQTAEYLEDTLELDDGDLVVLQARKNEAFSGGSTAMGRLRLALHKAAVAKGLLPAPTGFKFLWVTDFPLFSPSTESEPGQGGASGFSSTHHPFTSPKTAADVSLLATDPLGVTGEHYDIVVNGVELGGGSRRIHSAAMQEYVLREILKMSEERLGDFKHLLEVLRVGCPPHAGIALGFDRLIAVMLGKESVRDVIAFPKSGSGEDLLVKSPTKMTPEQLKTYHLKLDE